METTETTRDQLLQVLDAAIAPVEHPRPVPPEPPQPTVRVRVKRLVIVGGAYFGVDVRVGDTVSLTASEVQAATCHHPAWGEPLEDFPADDPYKAFYA